jgi:hypothetical protein
VPACPRARVPATTQDTEIEEMSTITQKELVYTTSIVRSVEPESIDPEPMSALTEQLNIATHAARKRSAAVQVASPSLPVSDST